MTRDEIFKELSFSYDLLVNYLLKKYGPAKYNYFLNLETMKSQNRKVSRTKEGLYCHHIDEDKGSNLSDSLPARLQPQEWQKSSRLVYCNALEHLILHIKIALLRQRQRFRTPKMINDFFTSGGIYQVCKQINDMYTQNGTKELYLQHCYGQIKENKEEYIFILRLLLGYLDQQYIGERDAKRVLTVGGAVKLFNTIGTIVGISADLYTLHIETEDGKKHSFDICLFIDQLSFYDIIDSIARHLSSNYNQELTSIYKDLCQSDFSQIKPEWYRLLLVDFHGYGFPQFTDNYIDRKIYGSYNIDEYISKAYPTFATPSYNISSEYPEFWQGDIPNKVLRNGYYFIVRIETSFHIKEGETPFIYLNGVPDLLRKSYLEKTVDQKNNNFLYRRGELVETTDYYDKKRDKYYSTRQNKIGQVENITATISLTKDDFELFLKLYDIRILKILDGCYFSNKA